MVSCVAEHANKKKRIPFGSSSIYTCISVPSNLAQLMLQSYSRERSAMQCAVKGDLLLGAFICRSFLFMVVGSSGTFSRRTSLAPLC